MALFIRQQMNCTPTRQHRQFRRWVGWAITYHTNFTWAAHPGSLWKLFGQRRGNKMLRDLDRLMRDGA